MNPDIKVLYKIIKRVAKMLLALIEKAEKGEDI